MKVKKSKKIMGGVAIAAVSLGCLGLAGIANAATTTTASGTASTTPAATSAPAVPNPGTTITTPQQIIFNVSKAQGETLTDHKLEYVKIGNYVSYGSGSTFGFVAANQKVQDVLYNFVTASSGGLKAAFPSASYSESADSANILQWLMTGNNSGPYLGADASGQNGYRTSENSDYAVRLLANYLYENVASLDSSPTAITLKDPTVTSDDYQSATWDAPSAGIYLIIDTTSGGNASLPIILSTEPGNGYEVPSAMKDFITNSIALKTQDPQAAPVKQFVTGLSSGSDLGGSITDSLSSSVGAGNLVTYQVSNVFPNTNGYLSYTYTFTDTPGDGLTLYIAKGDNMYVAGIPLSTLVDHGATVTLDVSGQKTTYTSSNLSSMPEMDGNGANAMTVSLDEAAMQYIQTNGYQTSNVVGKAINFSKLTSQSTVTDTVNGDTNTMAGANQGASSYTGQTQAASSGENGNSSSSASQAGGELFGLTYQAFLNTSAYNQATNIASTDNDGSGEQSSSSLPLKTNGSYNGGDTNTGGKESPTTQVNPSNSGGSTDGVPNNKAVGAGLTWMKIWGNGTVAQGAQFVVQNSQNEWLYASGGGWDWAPESWGVEDASHFTATTLNKDANPAAEGGLFQISGLADGTYTVSEYVAATHADPNVKPVFKITLTAGEPERVVGVDYANLVNNTPDGTPFNSTDYNTVENVKSIAGLPLTGGAGILAGVIAAVLLFGAAGIALVVYKRRKQND